jgi:cell wall-associated NlpC family hydrolase
MSRAWIAVLALPVALLVAVPMAAAGAGTLDPAPGGGVACESTTVPGGVTVAGTTLSGEQAGNARTIRDVGVAMAVPEPGQIIALATAMTESALRNLGHGDADSLGLFQQRPSAGWGTPAQIMDPVYSSRMFYQGLAKVPGWQAMPAGAAAQQVQRSAFPDRYAAWEPLATALVASMAATASACAAQDADTPLAGDVAGALPPGFTLPAGTPAPVVAAVTWALRQLGTSYYYGGSCTDSHSSDVTKHCDCSSLTQQAYRAGGIPLSRTTYTQIHEGSPVASMAALQPGDLIFLPGHVGMYLGQHLVVQAPHTGDVVKVSRSDAWASNFVAARRIAAD